MATLFQSTEENSIRDLVIARSKTASSGFSNGTLQKEQSKCALSECFQTTLELIYCTHTVESEVRSHDDTSSEYLKI